MVGCVMALMVLPTFCFWLQCQCGGFGARNHLCMENETISYFTLRTNTENLAQLLRTCFLKHNISSTTTMVHWNAHGGVGMIMNVDGSSIGNPGVSGFGGNTCADFLAKIGACNPEAYSRKVVPPDETSLLLLVDASEIFYSR
ncbi:hypothetical protein L195_g015564 [Trifolium pratense]|uniref:Uncharacterized protein n=1 Tax=Trifolium pratense TaxID=57577 RepID=A0A2K3MNR1_TRIPR|nr:hypothetical protein L195_g015564 [Trifolium pratense]